MSRIQSDVGLVTGINIKQTVDQLMAVASRPRTTLEARTKEVASERAAVDTLSSKLLALRFSTTTLKRTTTFSSRTVASSDPKAITAQVAVGKTPSVGSYNVSPLRTAAAHQVLSNRLGSLEDAFGSGSLKVRLGGHVDRGVSLSELNGGAGFQPGKLRITDRSGASAVVDLRAATTLDDVLAAINGNEELAVAASNDGGKIVLTDQSGGAGTFRVQEVSGGTTAASLGLGGLSQLSNTLTGQDVYRLGSGTRLASLNGGLGVRVDDSLTQVDDVSFTLRDGTTGGVDLSGAVTIGDVVARVAADTQLAGKVSVSVAADGKRLQVNDLTSGSGSFTVANGPLSTAAEALGLTTPESGGVVTGRRLVAGVRDTLIASLGGRDGFTLGSVVLADRAGVSATVDLSAAETLEEVVATLNGASPQVTARVNATRNGIELVDASGGSGALVVAESGGGDTAARLGIAVNAAVASVNGADLRKQVVSTATRLSSLNLGSGLKRGDIRLRDSAGTQVAVDLDFLGVKEPTLGDVIDKINSAATAAGVRVTASLNDGGDGLLMTDGAGGTGKLEVSEVSGGSTASSLRLLGASTQVDGQGRSVIDGTTSFEVDLTDLARDDRDVTLASLRGGAGIEPGVFLVTDSSGASAGVNLAGAATIGDVIDRINAASVSVTAAVNESGTGIELTDTAGGVEKLKVADLGSGVAASQLRLAGESTSTGSATKTINGSGLFAADAIEKGALNGVVARLNELNGGFRASLVFDGVGYRVALTAERTGAANELLVDGRSAGLTFSDSTRPADAAAVFGPKGSGGFAITSSTNSFSSVLDGVDLTVVVGSGEAVTVEVTSDDKPLVNAVKSFVESYNSVRTSLDEYTEFDAERLTTGVLFGRNEVTRVDSELARLISGRFQIGSQSRSLGSIGLSLDDDGKLVLDESRLKEAFEDDPTGLQEFFTRTSGGVVGQVQLVVDGLAGKTNSLLSSRSDTLQRLVVSNNEQLKRWDGRLERQRAALEAQFFALEQTVALLQTNLETLNQFQPVQPLASSRN